MRNKIVVNTSLGEESKRPQLGFIIMASRDSESDPNIPQAIDVPSVPSENESEVEQGRGRKKPRKVKEWGSVSSKVKRNLDQSYRGRHEPANKIVGAKALHVREHIKLLPAMSCHYSRVNAPHRKYLESHLTTEKLFVSYMEWLRDTYPEEKASLHYYSDVFTKEFNISFAPLVAPLMSPLKIRTVTRLM
ncbi:hypothetical protein Pcinc_010673 [Petrolisthes cinctipes]|uniref:Uncharacterized protein n=1 Tax=Petrolisthes cinctipes TaxID=88211 RepID=A0AAE1G8F1_PETCI|nr:hypothetical protein Pcinc_010673 [Petrolisthes cinctipes]